MVPPNLGNHPNMPVESNDYSDCQSSFESSRADCYNYSLGHILGSALAGGSTVSNIEQESTLFRAYSFRTEEHGLTHHAFGLHARLWLGKRPCEMVLVSGMFEKVLIVG